MLSSLAPVSRKKTRKLGVEERGPGARFSKVPVIYGPVNLPGHLSGSFIGPEVAFLEAPVNFPGTYRARKNSGPLPDSGSVTSRSPAGEGERVGTLFHSNHSLCATVRADFFFLRFDSKDNSICSKFNFGVVVVSKESNQEVIFMYYHVIYKR